MSTKPTEISSVEYEEEEDKPESFNSTSDAIILQPRLGQINGKSYTIYFVQLNWFAASEHCEKYGRVLASVTNAYDNEILQQTLLRYG